MKKVALLWILIPATLWLNCSSDDGKAFTITGRITFDYVPVTASGLNYAGTTAKPARRIVVEAVAGGSVVASAVTNDNGEYKLEVPGGNEVNVLATAKMAGTGAPDGIGPEKCNGASWDVRVLDGINKTQFALSNGAIYKGDDSLNMHAATTHNGSAYTARSGAPFAILDTILKEIEVVCSANAAQYFPAVTVYWSDQYDSTKIPGGTSNYNPGNSSLYILGKENVDTDEYDASVVAHEFGHYLEDKIFRSDSIGGTHNADSDFLDIRVAFGEGFGNAMGAITLGDPNYRDTNASSQGSIAVSMDLSSSASSTVGIYSEQSAGYMLYTLYTNRNSFDRIYSVLSNCQKNTDYVTSLLTFAYCYKTAYGYTADSLQSIWETDLDNPDISAMADESDSGNIIGIAYDDTGGGNPRTYSVSGTNNATFWRVYRTFTSGAAVSSRFLDGSTPSGGTHSSYAYNKYGAVKFFKLTGTGSTINIAVTLSGCGTVQNFQIKVLQKGKVIAASPSGGSTTPTLLFSSTNGTQYLLELDGWTNTCTGWTITQS